MDFAEQEWPSQTGRVEFHLNGGMTKISIWAGGLLRTDIPTDSIPMELRQIGTWLSLRLNSKKGWIIEGRGGRDPYIERWIAKQKDLKSDAEHTSDK